MSEFNKLWAGQTVSLVGTALTAFALPTLAVLTLHASAAQVGILVALETLPFPVLGMIVGVLADRLSRRKIMIAADLVRFVALATIPIAATLGTLRMPQLYVVSTVTGCASAFFGITYQAYLPALVSRGRITDANVKLELSNAGSDMLGKALAGVMIQWLGAATTIALDAISYVVSVFSLAWIRVDEPPHDGPPLSLRQGMRELGEGLQVVFRSPDLRWILGTTATSNLGSSMIQAVMFVYAYRVLHLQPGPLGLVFAFANLGFIGAFSAARVRSALGFRGTLITGAFGRRVGPRRLALGPVRTALRGALRYLLDRGTRVAALQRHPNQLPPKPRRRTIARSDERHDADVRLGNDTVGSVDRRVRRSRNRRSDDHRDRYRAEYPCGALAAPTSRT